MVAASAIETEEEDLPTLDECLQDGLTDSQIFERAVQRKLRLKNLTGNTPLERAVVIQEMKNIVAAKEAVRIHITLMTKGNEPLLFIPKPADSLSEEQASDTFLENIDAPANHQ